MRLPATLLCAVALGVMACNPTDSNAPNESAETANIDGGGMDGGGGAPVAEANAAGNFSGASIARVEFQGCPILRDVEGGCLVVESGGTTYDINSAMPRPDPARGLGIQGTGVPGGVSTCMTGTVLTDIKWDYTKMKCPIGGKE